MRIDRRFIIAVGVCLAADFAASLVRPFTCSSCSQIYGWPARFSYSLQGRSLWAIYGIGAGLMYDIVFAVTCGVIVWACWCAFISKELRKTEQLQRHRAWGWIRIFYGCTLTIDIANAVRQEIWSKSELRFPPKGEDEFAGMIFGNLLTFAFSFWLLRSGLRMTKAEDLPGKEIGIMSNTTAIPAVNQFHE